MCRNVPESKRDAQNCDGLPVSGPEMAQKWPTSRLSRPEAFCGKFCYLSNVALWREMQTAMRAPGAVWVPVLVVDFDGACAITHVVEDVADLGAKPVYNVIGKLLEYMEHFRLIIVSARAFCPEGGRAIEDALLEFGFPKERLFEICITNCKPPAHVSIDDRGWLFKGKWPAVKELLAFVPWHGRGIK